MGWVCEWRSRGGFHQWVWLYCGVEDKVASQAERGDRVSEVVERGEVCSGYCKGGKKTGTRKIKWGCWTLKPRGG